ncbi:hypothetical protein CGCF415_v014377 [Colletotrichum fructicola]|nr:hypothetical protein CGCF415_v014377 [Colletotrichum fructicola]KAF4893765.1 hypothetical protein CGCFRS4_v006881 [Colletotrichum fructicola]KAF4932169.1 hypothetical protein CGCF245_v010818 [Colletotrichum fructicola]
MHATTNIAARSIGHSRFSKSGVSCVIWTTGIFQDAADTTFHINISNRQSGSATPDPISELWAMWLLRSVPNIYEGSPVSPKRPSTALAVTLIHRPEAVKCFFKSSSNRFMFPSAGDVF